MTLDINLFREDKGNNPEIIRDSQRKRFARVELVDEVINLDIEWRQRQFEVDNLRKEFNSLNKQIANLKLSGGDATELIQQTEKNKEDATKKVKEVRDAYTVLEEKQKEIGNLVHDSVPVSKDEADNAVIKLWGEKRVASPPCGKKLKNHVELVELLDIVDTKRGAEIAGGRGFFLKGDGVLLNQALISFGLKFMKDRKFTLLQPPFFMRKKVMAKCAQLDNFDEQLYKVTTGDGDNKKDLTATDDKHVCDGDDKKDLAATDEKPVCDGDNKKDLTATDDKHVCDGDDKKDLTATAQKPVCDGDDKKDDGNDKYLIATAEQPLCAYHMDEWIRPSELPKRYAGYSTCFRKEAGSHGRDELGIFRVHQFEKIEQFCITSPNENDSWKMMEEMMENSEDFYKELKLPYRVVSIVSGALNDAAAKKYDLEAWFPSSETYRELVSCSNCTDYQARRLEIRYGQKKTNEQTKQYVHMLNSTLTATERTICCILENYQREDGVEIPEALQLYMGGQKFLPFKPI